MKYLSLPAIFLRSAFGVAMLGSLFGQGTSSLAADVDHAALEREVARLRLQLAAAEEKLAAAKASDQTQPASEGKTLAAPEPEEEVQQNAVFPGVWSYTIQLPVAFGYETNPGGLTDELPRRLGLSHKSSSFTLLNPKLSFKQELEGGVTYAYSYTLLRTYFHEQSCIIPFTKAIHSPPHSAQRGAVLFGSSWHGF